MAEAICTNTRAFMAFHRFFNCLSRKRAVYSLIRLSKCFFQPQRQKKPNLPCRALPSGKKLSFALRRAAGQGAGTEFLPLSTRPLSQSAEKFRQSAQPNGLAGLSFRELSKCPRQQAMKCRKSFSAWEKPFAGNSDAAKSSFLSTQEYQSK